MIEAFLIWIMAVITFLLGFFLGRGKESLSQVQQAIGEAKKVINKEPIGPVQRPTAQILYKTNNPEGRKIAEEEEAMRETFEKGIPEI